MRTRAQQASPLPGVSGAARVDRRTRQVLRRLRPGDVVVLDHPDMDAGTAEALIRARVGAVVNAAPSLTGTYPSAGPALLAAAGVPIVDGVGEGVFAAVHDGDRVRLDGGVLHRGGAEAARGATQDRQSVEAATEQAGRSLQTQLAAFAGHAAEQASRHRDLLVDGTGLPALPLAVRHRHVVVVSGQGSGAADLALLRPYLRRRRPVFLAADGGEAVLRAAGHRAAHVVPAEDDLPAAQAALLLAHRGGARLVVTAGFPAGLRAVLAQDQSVASSQLLAVLAAGGRVADARAVAELEARSVSGGGVLAVALAGAVAAAVAFAVFAGDGSALTGWLG